jgi:hypothetical protein
MNYMGTGKSTSEKGPKARATLSVMPMTAHLGLEKFHRGLDAPGYLGKLKTNHESDRCPERH